jgi:hypothetical protein
MADIHTTKGDVESGNTPVCYQETDPRYFETKMVDGGLEISEFTNNDLSYVVIPKEINGKKVTKIGNYAFEDCTSLTSIVIPNSVTLMGRDVFCGCSKLTIYCKAKRKPLFGWDRKWNSSKRPVVWGHKEN